jgi:hypothetical protein
MNDLRELEQMAVSMLAKAADKGDIRAADALTKYVTSKIDSFAPNLANADLSSVTGIIDAATQVMTLVLDGEVSIIAGQKTLALLARYNHMHLSVQVEEIKRMLMDLETAQSAPSPKMPPGLMPKWGNGIGKSGRDG